MRKIKLLVIIGPTASGKSGLAIRLARRLNGEVISADSRQVYRGMDIGTGKVLRDKVRSKNVEYRSQKLRHSSFENSYFSSGIRHHLLDIASPVRQYTAGKWKRAAQRAITDTVRRGKLPIICGGTGFWIDALIYDQQLPEVSDRAVRARLEKVPTDKLYLHLMMLDPVRAKSIDRHNRRRLIRAMEIVLLTGKPVPPLQKNGSPYEPFILGISMPKEQLKRRIEKRLDARLKQGMVAEVRRLHARGLSWKRLESFGLEYRWVARFLQKKITRTEMRDGLLRDIIAYSKRQMTWFRRNSDIVWASSELDAKIKVRHYHDA